MYAYSVPELRTEKVSVVLTPSTLARLDAYRVLHRWSRSTAIAALIEDGLGRDEDQDRGERQ
jgi:type III secretory pathway lipoprotein EscJ